MKKVFKKIKCFFLKNRVYLITIFISIILIIPLCFSNSIIFSVLSSIGCSGIAAALMAIFLDIKIDNDTKRKIKKAKGTYFHKLYDELVFIMQRILWFEERMNDIDFNWDLPLEEYSSLRYMVFSSKYPTEELIFSEAVKRLKICSDKYSLENLKLFSIKDREKINKMFSIISASGKFLIEYANNIKQNEIILDIENYLSLDKINSIYFNIGISLEIMRKNDKNYSLAIDLIINAAQDIRTECGFSGNIKVALMGTIPSNSI